MGNTRDELKPIKKTLDYMVKFSKGLKMDPPQLGHLESRKLIAFTKANDKGVIEGWHFTGYGYLLVSKLRDIETALVNGCLR